MGKGEFRFHPYPCNKAVQDVMMAITNRIDRFRGEANLTTWVHRITVNAALMHRRKDRSSSVVSLDTTSSDEALYETRLPQNPPVDRTLRILDDRLGCRGRAGLEVPNRFCPTRG